MLLHRISLESLPPWHPRSLHPFAPPVLQCPERGSPGGRVLTAGRVWGDPLNVSLDLGAEAPGEAWQSCASAVPGPPGTTSSTTPHGIPRPSLPAACHAESTAQKQPASLLQRKPASVSIATARDGGYHRAAARPVSLPVPVTQRAGQAVAGVAITSRGEAGDPQPSPPGDAGVWVGARGDW